jgi:cell division protein FtsB
MTTRHKRPAIWRHLFVTLLLLAFQGYLGYSFVTGQFGIESQDVLEAEMDELAAHSAALQAEIDAYRHRIELFRSSRLDPDILTEKARAMLAMARPEDIIVMVDTRTGKPLSGSNDQSTIDELSSIIAAETD